MYAIDTTTAKETALNLVQAAIEKRNAMAGQGDTYEYFRCSVDNAAIIDTLMGQAGWDIDENMIAAGLGSVAFARVETNREAGRKTRRVYFNIAKNVLTVVNGFGACPIDLKDEGGKVVLKKGATLTAEAFGLVVAAEVVAAKEVAKQERKMERASRDRKILSALES